MVESEALKFLGSAAGGAILGGVAGLVNKWMDARSQRARELHEIEMRKLDTKQMRVEFEGAAIVRSTEADTISGLALSYKQDVGGGRRADVFRGLMRPMLTGLLTVAAIAMNIYIIGLLTASWREFTQTQQFGIIWSAIDWMGFQSSTAISWWFGARGERPKR